MARWHLTSNVADHERASRICDAAELTASGEVNEPGHQLRTYAKRSVASCNFHRDGDDWIAVAGTVLCDGLFGGDALPAILARARDESLARARRHVIGHYALVCRQGDEIVACTDEQGSISLYVTRQGSRLIVSNSLHVVAGCLDQPRVDPLEMLSHTFQKMSAGPATFFSQVQRLFGAQVVRVDVTTGHARIEEVDTPLRRLEPTPATITEAVDAVVDIVRPTFDQLRVAPSLALNTTGGIDTRTLLAAVLDRDLRPQLLYGVGNSRLTNTKAADHQIAQQLAESTGLPLYTMDWSGTQPHPPEKMHTLFRRYGFLYSVFASSDGLLREVEGAIDPYPTLQLGGYTPAFTNRKPWEIDRDEFAFDDLIDNFLEDRHRHLRHDMPAAYVRHVERAVGSALRHAPVAFPEHDSSREAFTISRLFLHLRRESRTANFFNEFSYYLAPFMIKQLYDPLVTLPLPFREHDEFQTRLIHALAPELLDIPTYSGMKHHEFDRESLTMRRVESPTVKRAARVRTRIARRLPRIGKDALKRAFAHTPLRRLLLLNRDDVKDLSINDRVRDEVSASLLDDQRIRDLVDRRTLARIDLRSLHYLHSFLFGATALDGHVDAPGHAYPPDT